MRRLSATFKAKLVKNAANTCPDRRRSDPEYSPFHLHTWMAELLSSFQAHPVELEPYRTLQRSDGISTFSRMVEHSRTALDRVFHALGDPTRRAMILQLASKPCTVTELAQPHEMSLAAASKHVKVLEEAGLVQRKI